jgi:hypothetical protein
MPDTPAPKKVCLTEQHDAVQVVVDLAKAAQAHRAASLAAIRAGHDPDSPEYEAAVRPSQDAKEILQSLRTRLLAAYAGRLARTKSLTPEECLCVAALAGTVTNKPQWVKDLLREQASEETP